MIHFERKQIYTTVCNLNVNYMIVNKTITTKILTIPHVQMLNQIRKT